MTSTMRFDKWENSLGQPYGTVLQAVEFVNRGQADTAKTTLLTVSTTTFTNFMTCSITTKQPNSKIFVFSSATGYTNGGNLRGKARLTRNGTNINADMYAFYCPVGIFQLHTFNIIDSPSVATGTTLVYNYDVAISSAGNPSFSMGYGDGSGGPSSSIVLLEIAQ